MKYGIRAIEIAGVGEFAHSQEWLQSYSDTTCGRGRVTFTPNAKHAMEFGSFREAFAFWQQRSKTVPTRTDGKPNRPLTAYTCSIEKLP